MNQVRNLKRPLLYLLVGSVILGAVLGIALVLRNKWGWFEVRVILTTITIAIGSLCGLACDVARTPRGANVLPRLGLLLSLAGTVLMLVGIWTDETSGVFWKTTVVTCFFGVATVHVCLLSIMRLSSRFHWVYLVACQVIYGLAMLLTIMLVWEVGDDGMIRIVVATSIIDAALTLVIPLLHRISRSETSRKEFATPLEQRNIATIDAELTQLRKRIGELEKLRAELEQS